MKKFSLILLCAVMLAGCAEKTDVPDSVSIAVPETTTGITTEAVTTQPQKIASRSGFIIDDTGIKVIRRGEIWQTLRDTNIYEFAGQVSNTEVFPEYFLIKKDFDNDGHLDLFVPYMYADEPITKGVYYHFDPDTAIYEKWDTFNKIGVYLESASELKNISQFRKIIDDNCVYFTRHLEDKDIYYSYDGSNLEYAGKFINYTDDEGNEYTDTFLKSYITGNEQLVRRTKNMEEIFVHPSQCSVITEENKVSVIWHIDSKGDYDTIQTFEGSYQKYKTPAGHCTPPAYTAVLRDIDGDGYADIYITEGENAGKYFSFNPVTFQFDEVEL